jgi:type II secretory pathway pseudopilin PulG
MSINFTCPHCNKNMQVDDAYAGQTGPCAGCGQTITIPGPAKPLSSAPMGMAPPKPGLPPMPGPAGYGGPGFGDSGFAPPPKSSSSAGAIVAVMVVAAVALLFCSGILVALLLPAVQSARFAARRAQSMNNMKQLMLALHNYESNYGSFPPAFVADASGKPLYSWRVLVLPYLGDPVSMTVSQRFDLTKAWDSPENLALSQMMVPTLQSPNDQPGCCSYMALAGPNTLFSGASGTKLSAVADGTSNTIAFVEVAGRQQSWAEPKDVDLATLPTLVGTGPGQIPGKPSPDLNVAMADGSVRRLRIAPETEAQVRAMSTINGGEPVAP